MRRTASIALGAATIAGVAALLSVAASWRDAPPAGSSAAAAASAPWCAPGHERRWDLTFDVDITPPGAHDAIRMTIVGQWSATPSALRGDECDVALELASPRVVGTGVGHVSDADVAAWQRRLERRFWITYRRDGAALQAHFSSNTDPSDRNLLQMIATESQVVRPERDTDHWTALERDAAGTYLADYVRVTPGKVAKRKLTYTSIDAASGARAPDGVAVEIVASEHAFSFDRAGGVSEVEGSEQLRIGVPMGPNTWLGTRTSIRLHDVRVARVPSVVGSLERERATLDSSAIRTHNPDPERALAERDAALLEGRTTEDLLAAAQAHSDDHELPARLAALFRRRPNAVPAALAIARTRDDASRITEALAAADSATALMALGMLAHDRAATEGARVDALNALVLVTSPSLETIRIPGDLLDDSSALVRRAALLCSGALARAGRREHREASDSIDLGLVARYAAARDDRARLEVLSALGNSAGPLVLPILDGALHGDRPEVRAAAASALRLAEEPDVDTWLARVITSDGDPRVRSAGLFAASFRPIGPLFDALERVATRDPVEALRRDASALLKRAQRSPTRRVVR